MGMYFAKAFLLLLVIICAYPSAAMKVGVYDNPPKIFLNGKGEVDGFWHDVTDEIAQKENWEIEWVYGSWDECLHRLETGEIDIMPDTGVTPERELKYIFNEETVYLSWNRVYSRISAGINTVLDLEGKKVAGLRNSFDLEGPEGFVTDITLSKTAEMEIREKSEELERTNRLMVDRELKMIELKKEINALLKNSGKEPKYITNEQD